MTDATTASTFIERFDEIVRKFGDRPAVFENGELSYCYSDLQKKAHSLALRLLEAGVEQGEIVGIAMAKSADYIVSLLAIWYAGAAFVPLDPALPVDRLTFMCADANVRFVLINSSAQESSFEAMNIVTVAVNSQSITNAPAALVDLPGLNTAVADNAYVIFTSGTTGKPKGVLVTHRGIVSFIMAQIAAFELDHTSRSLWYLSISFDASVSDLGTALLSGAALYIEDPGTIQPGAGLEDILTSRAITFVDIPPSMLRLLSPELLPDSLKSICIGGEACALDVVRTYAGKLNLVNVYGPTEATVCTSLGRCQATWSEPLIGQPLPGITYKILDDNLNEVTAGTIGQLHIGGISLAAGYLNRPELTAAKFIEHKTGERLYRTGDLVLLNQAGEYQFIGRCDRQFKLRGMLIEPEEIESQLLKHAAVERAAVLKRAAKSGSTREILVAFVSLKKAAISSVWPDKERVVESIDTHLALALPRWMLPQRLEVLEEMPLTVTDKIDFSALQNWNLEVRAPQAALLPGGADCSAISSSDNSNSEHVQALLIEVFKQVLGIDHVGADDDFYDLGGDSFAVVEACVVASALGLDLPPALLMNHPVINELTEAYSVLGDSNETIASAAGGMAASDILADIAIPADLQELMAGRADNLRNQKNVGAAKNIFLTGATGYLGSRLLVEILHTHPTADLYCLVRADSEDTGRKRIAKALSQHGAGYTVSGSFSRVHIVCGNIEQERFGLSTGAFNELATTIDTVYHCAAQVNNLASYHDLRAANVVGTFEIVRLLVSGAAKCLHYISTLSVFVATDQNHGILLENDELEGTGVVYGGYAQTKWAAEKLLRNLDGAAGPISYYRLGLITGDSVTGNSADHDFLNLFVSGISSLGCAPALLDTIAVDITPVDFAARAVVALASHGPATGTAASTAASTASGAATYHIANTENLTLQSFLSYMQKEGMALDIVTPENFRKKLLSRVSILGGAESAACMALCRSSGDSFASFRTMDLFQATDVKFDNRNASAVLEPLGIICPPPSSQLLQLYLKAFLTKA
jgi:myxalamid-type nonribosomal peptide synthetase MxaA